MLKVMCAVGLMATSITTAQSVRELAWDPGFAAPQPHNGVADVAVSESDVIYMAGGNFPGDGDGLATWEGTGWVIHAGGVAGNTTGSIRDLLLGDDGETLFVGGRFTHVGDGIPARHVAVLADGQWATLGGGVGPDVNDVVLALARFDSGQGTDLYVAGQFEIAEGKVVNHIARWTGNEWVALGTGVDNVGLQPEVRALAVFDDGSGEALYVAGRFDEADGMPAANVAKWNGYEWSELGAGLGMEFQDTVETLLVANLGDGPRLIAGGRFEIGDQPGAYSLAEWTGESWVPVGGGIDLTNGVSVARVDSLAVYDHGKGPVLYVGGNMKSVGGEATSNLAAWDGASWRTFPEGPDGFGVPGLFVVDLGRGDELLVTAASQHGDLGFLKVVLFNGTSWRTPSDGLGCGLDVMRLVEFDDGHGKAVFAIGRGDHFGNVYSPSFAKFQNGEWIALPDPGMTLLTLGVGPIDGVDRLLAGGYGFETDPLHSWDGQVWTPVGTGFNGTVGGGVPRVDSIGVYDGMLHVGGHFLMAGNVTVNHIARLTPEGWQELGDGVMSNLFPYSVRVETLFMHDDGEGDQLYASGIFDEAGGVATPGIARWNGQTWSPVGDGFDSGWVLGMATFDDGTGPALYVSGTFSHSGGEHMRRLAKWDGKDWTPVPPDSSVGIEGRGILVHDIGDGPVLLIGGMAIDQDGYQEHRLASWDGNEFVWTDAFDGTIDAIIAPETMPGRIMLAGEFGQAVDTVSSAVAVSLPSCPADYNRDGQLNVLDFVAFQLGWQALDPAADCDGDGEYDVLDYLCFQVLFQAGCP